MAREKDLGPGELGPPWTVLKLLRWTTGYFEEKGVTKTPRLDADLLLADVLGLERVQLYARVESEVEPADRKAFRALVKRRAEGEPVAYLVGHREFWQLDLETDDRALIPRPETEVLVEVALEKLPEPEGDLRVADIGTGTGAVAFALAGERPDIRILATDNSEEALELAGENAEALGLDERVGLVESDLFESIPPEWGPFDLIVANPPYVPEEDRDEVMIDVRQHEPEEALFAGPDGLAVLERLIPQAYERLAEGGWFATEIGHQQGERVAELFADAGFDEVEVRQDYSDHDRVVVGRK